jgi:hypothetical protein
MPLKPSATMLPPVFVDLQVAGVGIGVHADRFAARVHGDVAGVVDVHAARADRHAIQARAVAGDVDVGGAGVDDVDVARSVQDRLVAALVVVGHRADADAVGAFRIRKQRRAAAIARGRDADIAAAVDVDRAGAGDADARGVAAQAVAGDGDVAGIVDGDAVGAVGLDAGGIAVRADGDVAGVVDVRVLAVGAGADRVRAVGGDGDAAGVVDVGGAEHGGGADALGVAVAARVDGAAVVHAGVAEDREGLHAGAVAVERVGLDRAGVVDRRGAFVREHADRGGRAGEGAGADEAVVLHGGVVVGIDAHAFRVAAVGGRGDLAAGLVGDAGRAVLGIRADRGDAVAGVGRDGDVAAVHQVTS